MLLILIFAAPLANAGGSFREPCGRRYSDRTAQEANAEGWIEYGPPDSYAPQHKIAGSSTAEPGQFPWAVAFATRGINFCTGVIIGPRHVLTAAHCVYEFGVVGVPCGNSTALPYGLELQVLYGGVCVDVDKDVSCYEKDTKQASVRKVALSLDYVEGNCECGSDIAIIEVKEQFECYAAVGC